jgi:hypothetical protein
MSTVISEDKLMKIWQWCHDAYLQYGIKLNFPKGTDPTKTYQWRYIKSISKKFEEWGFDDITSQRYIQIVVSQAKKHNILRKGLAALHQKHMLEYCYNILSNQIIDNKSIQKHLTTVKSWYDAKIQDQEALNVLLKRSSKRALPNLIIWYQSSQLDDLFISLSKACGLAARSIKDEAEKRLIPSSTTLYLVRNEFLSETNNSQFAKQLFGSDWRN